MNLQIIGVGANIEEVRSIVQRYFNDSMQLIQMNMSMFEQYQIRPVKPKHIWGIWQYRVVVTNGLYYFGKI